MQGNSFLNDQFFHPAFTGMEELVIYVKRQLITIRGISNNIIVFPF